jgi:hypothetical protein
MIRKTRTKLSDIYEASVKCYSRAGFYDCSKTAIKLFLRSVASVSVYPLLCYIYSKRQWHFTFNNSSYDYFYHPYNKTWMSERAVEIAIIWEEVKKYDAERVLEVGNTLSHYYPVHHDIVDQFDKAERVINVDIVDFFTPKKYDLIVSISTIEHIGIDEERYTGKKDTMSESPDKVQRAVDKLKNCINQKGRIIITAPVGYNQTFDRLLKGGVFTNKRYLRRISKNNRWVEINESEICNAKYDEPFKLANVLAICLIENP